MAVHHRPRAPRLHQADGFRPRSGDQITAQNRVRLAQGHPNGADVLGRIGQPQMNMHRTALLRQTGHFHHAGPFAVDMRGLRKDRADGDNAGAANAGDHHVVGAVNRGHGRFGQIRQIDLRGRGLFRGGALQRHKGRAKAVDTTEILVAGRLVNRPLAPQFGFHRHDRNTVGLHPAIAAAFADIGIDKHPFVRIGKQPALAATALFGGAGLDIKNDRHTLDFTKFPLNFHQLCALIPFQPRRKRTTVNVLFFIIDYGNVFHPHRLNLAGDARCVQIALVRLPAGHCHRVVIQDLVGHRGARRHGRADRHNARMVVGAITDILEHMARL